MEILDITDTERLDFLEKYVEATQAEEEDALNHTGKYFIVSVYPDQDYWGKTIREAIDSAIIDMKDEK